jgi:hypothetical protein
MKYYDEYVSNVEKYELTEEEWIFENFGLTKEQLLTATKL